MTSSFKIIISGQVQGVGFRPFVFNLALKYGIKGTVSNNEEGVIIYATGAIKKVQAFYNEIISNPPPVSRIINHLLEEIEDKSYVEFNIISTEKNTRLNLQLTPDFAICSECVRDLDNPENRRFNYPFTTCVNCGPRWAITETFPFERFNTSIDVFKMCKACLKEYKDPLNRRFHSQTNTCLECGILPILTDNKGRPLTSSYDDIFKKTAQLIESGSIVAIKNSSGYLLCCSATDKQVIKKLREKKNRPKKPFAILYKSIEDIELDIDLNQKQKQALISPERPIIIVNASKSINNLSVNDLAPGLNQLGIMLPYSGILQMLADCISEPIVATSGNLHGSPILSEEASAIKILGSVADYFVHHNLEILNPQDDSVIKFSSSHDVPVLFRRSRGFAPNYYGETFTIDRCILAMGGELKSTLSILPNDFLYVSQYLGSLNHFDVYERFENTANYMIGLFERNPEVILVDSHPLYLSTQLGKSISQTYSCELVTIQHHKAHFAAVLAEHALLDTDEEILGVIWDGTGYGEDSEIWGGEFFKYQAKRIDRLGHFRYFDWIAGDKMANEPRLSLFSIADDEFNKILDQKFSKQEQFIYKALKQKARLKTSSVGRLFDAAASLLGICDFNTYEGEAAILLENAIDEYDVKNCRSYLISTTDANPDPGRIIKGMLRDKEEGHSIQEIIANFLYTLAKLILDYARQRQIKKIALSGGVFQNTTLIDMLMELVDNDMELLFNLNLAPNDENISFGQMMYYINGIN
ncbi:MAG: carbamoyltransferase HypF [Flavobacteriaceae bacterium]|nr:carbamoyltransferase HypF [Flavobacteriaceae bacterium]